MSMNDDTLKNGDAATTEDLRRSAQDLAEQAERRMREEAERMRVRAQQYYDEGRERFDDAQRYLTQQVQEKPIQTTLAAVGVGVLLGLLLSGRRR